MKRPPRDPKAPFIGRGSILELLGCGLVMSCVTLLLYSMELGTPFSGNYERAKAIAFMTLILFQIFNAANYRSEDKSIFTMHPFSNKYFVLAVLAAFTLQLLVVYIPALQPMFETYPITALDWMFIIAASSSIIAFYEAKKAYQRKKRRS